MECLQLMETPDQSELLAAKDTVPGEHFGNASRQQLGDPKELFKEMTDTEKMEMMTGINPVEQAIAEAQNMFQK